MANTNRKKVPDATDIHVGARVRTRRMMLGMSQEKLGNALGLTFQQVQKYEKGKNRIGASRLQQIAHILQVPVSYFFEQQPGVVNATGVANDYTTTFLADHQGLQLARLFVLLDAPASDALLTVAEAFAGKPRSLRKAAA